MSATERRRPANVLVVFAGLPGTGKSTLARLVAQRLPAAYLRIDAAEAGLVEAGLAGGPADVGAAGYIVAGRVAENCLDATDVVVDAVNPVTRARNGWRRIATSKGVALLFVEVTCSDVELHRRRVETRVSDLPELPAPTWRQVRAREYEPWDVERLVVDNVDDDPETQVDRIVAAVSRQR